MSLINIFVSSSVVVVVTVFLYFLYQTKKLNNLAEFDYDIDPSRDVADNTYKLICPEGYSYDTTENVVGGDIDICKSTSGSDTLRFDTLKKHNEFKYPDLDTGKHMSPMRSRCTNSLNPLYEGNLDWPNIQPYCEYSDLHNK